jgi:hypothetical protein
MARPKGQPKLGGRQKGSVNKTTVRVKEALESAFHGIGGVPALMAWAKEEPGEFYKLWSKLLPQDVKVEGGLDIRHVLAERLMEAEARVGKAES